MNFGTQSKVHAYKIEVGEEKEIKGVTKKTQKHRI